MKLRELYLVISLVVSSACSSGHDVAEKAPAPDDRVGALRELYAAALLEADALRDPATGWITPGDCDGFLWTAKYAAASGVSGVHLEAAEYPQTPGRFDRRPPPGACQSDNPEWSSWSRDMGTGLIAYAVRKGDLAMLQRHEAYGRANHWQMGEPLGDARAVYTPSMVGRLYEGIFVLGGGDNVNRYWPDLYPPGLTDYQAHLQVMSIMLRGEQEEILRTGNLPNPTRPEVDDQPHGSATLLDISKTALDTLQTQAARDPRDPLFAAALGVYTGDMAPAITACLAEDQYAGEYVRCNEARHCQLAAWIFACDSVLRRFPQ